MSRQSVDSSRIRRLDMLLLNVDILQQAVRSPFGLKEYFLSFQISWKSSARRQRCATTAAAPLPLTRDWSKPVPCLAGRQLSSPPITIEVGVR